jgi:hypothetical protein
MLQELASSRREDECFTLAFPEDAALEEFQTENPGIKSVHPGRVAVGCFWVACKQQDSELTVTMTSATRSISTLMKESSSVQGSIRELATHATSGSVQVVDEWNQVSTL